MPQKPETRLVNKTLALLRKHGAWVFKVHGDPLQPVVIDLIGIIDGMGFALEAKVGDNEPTALQRLTMKQVAAAGGITGVFRTPEEALQLLTRERADYS